MANDKALIAVWCCSTYKINNVVSGHFTSGPTFRKMNQLIKEMGIKYKRSNINRRINNGELHIL